VIAPGYDETLDELRRISEHGDEALLDLETRERERTGFANLRFGYNRVQGYYIEVSRSQADRVPVDWVRRQTVKNAERYITTELKAFEDRVLGARDRSLARERELYEGLLDELAGALPVLQKSAAALAELDVLANLAERARTLRLARPALIDDTRIAIEAGRHIVVEQTLDSPFVPNDLDLHRRAPHADRHGAEHGRQVDVHAAGRADRDSWPASAASSRRVRRRSGRSTGSSRASARPMISRAGGRPSWSR
jgi:DNA mismatch repair protein MutS